jgi:hypothetical protein
MLIKSTGACAGAKVTQPAGSTIRAVRDAGAVAADAHGLGEGQPAKAVAADAAATAQILWSGIAGDGTGPVVGRTDFTRIASGIVAALHGLAAPVATDQALPGPLTAVARLGALLPLAPAAAPLRLARLPPLTDPGAAVVGLAAPVVRPIATWTLDGDVAPAAPIAPHGRLGQAKQPERAAQQGGQRAAPGAGRGEGLGEMIEAPRIHVRPPESHEPQRWRPAAGPAVATVWGRGTGYSGHTVRDISG